MAEGNAGIYQGIGGGSYRKLFAYHLERLKGWCDEPVSSDVKRLIRAPGSLHGKTGLRAIPLSRDQVDRFDPLVDAVVLGDDPVAINVSRPIQFTLKGEPFDLKPGVQKLPLYAAVFTILRRHALLEGDTPPAPPPPKAAPQAPAGKPG
jgi:DNA primase small subunit